MNEIKTPKVQQALYETLGLLEFPPINSDTHLKEIYLLCLFADEVEIETYKTHFPKVHFKRWHPYIVNVLEEDVSKSVAIQKVLDYFGYTNKEAIAFGDGENDLSMFDCGHAVAMGNAMDTVKAQADEITLDNNSDGIAVVIEKLI